jgi:hypothetical protein
MPITDLDLAKSWPTEIQFTIPASQLYGHYMTSIHDKLRKQLAISVEKMQKNYNKPRKTLKALKKEKLVVLNRTNIGEKHQCKKLEGKKLGPFEVLSVESNLRYSKLILPE